MEEIIQFISENPRLFWGNFFGFIAVVFGIISGQMKSPKLILLIHDFLIVALMISYAILGAWTGFAMNLICLFRNISYSTDNVPLFKKKWWPFVLALVIGCGGILSWQGPISIIVIISAMINTVCMSLNDGRKMQASLLLTCNMNIVYDVVFDAYLALIMEASVVISSLIGLIRGRKEKQNKVEA